MSFVMHLLASKIMEQLSPALLVTGAVHLEALEAECSAMAARLRLECMEAYGGVTKESQAAQLVRSLQSCSVQLINQLDLYIAELPNTPGQPGKRQQCVMIYERLLQVLFDLLDQLADSYPIHWNPEQRMPDRMCISGAAGLREKCTGLKTKFISPPALQWISLLEEMLAPSLQPGNGFSYGSFSWWYSLLEKLLSPETDTSDRIVEVLLLWNCNDSRVVKQSIQLWQAEADTLVNKGDCMAFWETIIVSISQHPPFADMCLYPGNPGIQPMLQQAVETILNNLRQSHRLYPTQATRPGIPADERFRTSLSVSQLALFFRLQVDADILLTDNKEILMEQLARQFQTRRTEQISADSLYRKYYACDTASIAILKTRLVDMLNLLKKYEVG